jgi:hypothetical protein
VVLVGVAISFYAPAYGLGWFVDAVLLAIAAVLLVVPGSVR